MDREQLSKLLESMRSDLENISNAKPGEDAIEEANRFMSDLYHLGLEWHNNPELGESPQYLEFIQESSRLLPHALTRLDSFVNRLEASLYKGLVSDWKSVSEKRSSIEFLFELYRDSPFAEFLPMLELGDLDPALRRQAVFEGYVPPEQIPTGLPSTHWWWRPTDYQLRFTS